MAPDHQSFVAVITTIQDPTESVRELVNVLRKTGAGLIVVGDKKGPNDFEIDGCEFYSFDRQNSLQFELARRLPIGHYSRKNLGYLIAFSRRAKCIYETDDDNAPLPGWGSRCEVVDVQKAESRPWFNVYRMFTDELIWPRGFPLDRILDPDSHRHDPNILQEAVRAPIQQGLANGAPDVDALWRLVLDRPFEFRQKVSVWLAPRTYCPFNSQSTWWWPVAFPLMYLPSHCSFRMTDIWRSFIAQRCIWEMGYGLVFHAAEVHQLRNSHDLMRDFSDEVPGYLGNDQMVRILNQCALLPGEWNVGENLRRCYQALTDEKIFPDDEMKLVNAWLADVAAVSAIDPSTTR